MPLNSTCVMQPTDEEILGKWKLGEKELALRLLIRRYSEPLYWHIRKMLMNHDDTDDVLQNVYIKVWKGLERFQGKSALYTWLYRIASNEAITHLRKNKKHRSVDVEHDFLENVEQSSSVDGNQAALMLQTALQKLPAKQKLVFNMRYFDDMNYKDMSEVLSTSVGALKASYHHAVKKIERSINSEL